MEKSVELKNIPWGYTLCFNGNCQLRERCLHFLAGQQKPDDVLGGPAIYPDAWKGGECLRFREAKLVQIAWGFSQIYRNVPHYLQAEARRSVRYYFSKGKGPYYRYHHGDNKLSPRQQQDIMNILAKYGPTDGLVFDHYEQSFDFG